MAVQPASPDVVAQVKEGFECWNGGEIDLMADSYADDAEVDTTQVVPDGRVYRGREDFVRYFHETWDAWERIRMEPLEVIDVGGDRLVVDVKVSGQGRHSGIEVDQRMGYLYSARDGLLVRLRMFPTKEAALAAAEQEEEG